MNRRVLPVALMLAAGSFMACMAQEVNVAVNSGWTFAGGGAGVVGQGGPMINGVKGKPWSGEEVTERVQTLADGTRITQQPQKTVFYRDSEGRTRTEHVFAPPMGRAAFPGMTMIEIEDPVAGYRYNFNMNDQVAHRMKWPPAAMKGLQRQLPATLTATVSGTLSAQPAARVVNGVRLANGVSAADPSIPRPETTREPLGAQTIEGVVANGTRMTQVYPVGFFGNDRPITTVSETWMSPELGRVVLSKMSDPRSGESTTKLTNVSRGEPDPSLFQPPAGYEVKDDTPGAN